MSTEASAKSRSSEPEQISSADTLDGRLSALVFSRLGSRIPRGLLLAAEHSGNGLLWIPSAALLTFYGGDTSTIPSVWGANLMFALMLDLLAVGLIKGLVRRPRPVYNDSSDFLTVATVDSFSFPSGHSSRMSMVAVLALMWSSLGGSSLGILVLLWALLVALSRVALGRHYVSDVLAGLLLGVVVSGVVTQGSFSSDDFLVTGQQVVNVQERVAVLWAKL